ncbi:hypothetical protein K438DRAFT_1768994 [Mycena galopus ATCC 62051]|nr:hypothetical protein K438DRAFT_1768994 [Mycena galopus ATCC 62051]
MLVRFESARKRYWVDAFRPQVMIDNELVTILDDPCAENFVSRTQIKSLNSFHTNPDSDAYEGRYYELHFEMLALKPECYDAVTMRVDPQASLDQHRSLAQINHDRYLANTSIGQILVEYWALVLFHQYLASTSSIGQRLDSFYSVMDLYIIINIAANINAHAYISLTSATRSQCTPAVTLPMLSASPGFKICSLMPAES